MTPAPGDRLQRFVGDGLGFELRDRDGRRPLPGWQARLRTNLGRADQLRREILQAHTRGLPLAGASWRDLPMDQTDTGWTLRLPLSEIGYFQAKAYLVDPRGWQHWTDGPNLGISVHPDRYRTANILYCAFPRMFGASRTALNTQKDPLVPLAESLDQKGYTVIPPSGKLRDLTAQLPHLMDHLGCRILHLLPVHPTPTTGLRLGRFGSPYAVLDLAAIDPALIVFDKRTTGIDQFRELTYATHLRGGRVFLDIVINHTGWSSVLQENHPEWFLRLPDGSFASPGAWGTVWEDLVELKHENVALWDTLAEIFLTWCRRGVDGFRCDAGYKVPVPAWQYIVARVQQEYPETIFFLEGLGGAWEATEALLTEGGMQWAYSELFQNHSGVQVGGYLDHALKQLGRVGLLVHYSETHDNERLAARSRIWSLLRNRLCGLTSSSGGFGFTCGVEWLATEKIRVHGSTGMAWGNPDNLVPELAKLNSLLADHPCFFDGARLTRLSPVDSPVYALYRQSAEGKDSTLVLANTDPEEARTLTLDWGREVSSPVAAAPIAGGSQARSALSAIASWTDLLGQPKPEIQAGKGLQVTFKLAPGAAFCLSPASTPQGLHGDAYRRNRAQAAWALTAASQVLAPERLGQVDWKLLGSLVERRPMDFLARLSQLAASSVLRAKSFGTSDLEPLPSVSETPYPPVITWTMLDLRRVTLVPPDHWLLVRDPAPFRASLNGTDPRKAQNVESIPVQDGHIACFGPVQTTRDATLHLERYDRAEVCVAARLRFLSALPAGLPARILSAALRPADRVLLTNGRGAMARMSVDLGRIESKYDCALGANLHPTLPVDRHIFVKRLRAWIVADGFISPLDFRSLISFEPGPPAAWNFVAHAGDGRTVEIQLTAAMPPGANTTLFQFSRPSAAQAVGKQLPAEADVRITVRVDLEDRNFHSETKRNGGADHHFSSHLHPLAGAPAGFRFAPAQDRQLRVFCEGAEYHPQPEWCENLPHPIESSRGQTGSGDAFSPGWFDLPLPKGAQLRLVVTADPRDPGPAELDQALARPAADAMLPLWSAGMGEAPPAAAMQGAGALEIACPSRPLEAAAVGPADTAARRRNLRTAAAADDFGRQLNRAARAFVVQRGEGQTVIAGYPWFLDWGRDTFICARGLLAAGMSEEVRKTVLTFARFEQNGTLPNTIHGEDASNRDTSDAPLWFGVVCEELAGRAGDADAFYSTRVQDASGRQLREVLRSIARHYLVGTPNNIRMDPASGLIWSPSHFTWMDTNYPACTPRQGYPVEIQALWIRLLRHLAAVFPGESKSWNELAERALASLNRLFWLPERGYYADVLQARPGQPAAEAVADDALRGNGLFVVSLGLAEPERARRCVQAAQRYLVVPGALRSLAPLPVTVPLPNQAPDGRLLNHPTEPYWGRYEGDEDTRRKPAYHNGTAWTWTFPVFCEALARAWNFSPESLAAARAYLGSMDALMSEGCLGQLPELTDGDTPHTQRGCDAQAWGATEALRVWTLLSAKGP